MINNKMINMYVNNSTTINYFKDSYYNNFIAAIIKITDIKVVRLSIPLLCFKKYFLL